MARILLYDIDGFVADSSERQRKYLTCLPNEPERFHKCIQEYSKTVEGDLPIWPGINWVRGMRGLVDRCVALTSREESGREPTLSWLRDFMGFRIESCDVIMRESGLESSKVTPVDLKRSHVERILSSGDEIVCAGDDHVDICRMYRDMGVPAFLGLFPGVDCSSHVGEPKL